ncbi:MAG: Maf family protein [Firmicutes bacterium]|nr:Maf family protein [Bacillota bacterium]
MEIILASGSKRRIELLSEITKDFKILPANINENIEYKNPFMLTLSLSRQKADYVFLENKNALVIGADTIVCLKDRIFPKPESEEQAIEFIKVLRGKTHTVITAVCFKTKNSEINILDKTGVTFNNLTDKQVKEYVEKFKPLDKSGSYGIQDKFCHIKSYDGDIYTVIGFPVSKVKFVLENFFKMTV